MTYALRTEGLTRSFGAFKANSDISLAFEAGARHAIIGPNGAGKTTFINLLTGVLAPSSGEVYLAEENITGLAQYARVKRGMTRTFQINTLFPGLTVLESIVLACCERDGEGNVWWRSASRAQPQIDEARSILGQLRLDRDAAMESRNLPYGKQRLLEIALALATRPRVLLLDEPAAGIPSAESSELFGVIAALPRDVIDHFHRARHEPRVQVRGENYGAGRRIGSGRRLTAGNCPRQSRARGLSRRSGACLSCWPSKG